MDGVNFRLIYPNDLSVKADNATVTALVLLCWLWWSCVCVSLSTLLLQVIASPSTSSCFHSTNQPIMVKDWGRGTAQGTVDCSGGSLKLVLFVGVILVSDLVATLQWNGCFINDYWYLPQGVVTAFGWSSWLFLLFSPPSVAVSLVCGYPSCLLYLIYDQFSVLVIIYLFFP